MSGDGYEGKSRKPGKPGGGGASPPAETAGPDPADCPVTALGSRDGLYWFFRPNGELRSFRARDLDKDFGLEDLFGRKYGWLYDHFSTENGYSTRAARRWLIAQCEAAGLFDPAMPRRGPGVWRDGETLAVHCGDMVLIGGDWRPAGFREGEILYALAPRIARPASRPASAADGRKLIEMIGLWRFDDAAGPDLTGGFIGQSHYGAAADWRPHMFTRAQYGAGKSLLAELVAGAAGARPPGNNVTAASIYQALTGEARALVIDEAEKSERDDRIAQVIELTRLMSGRAGAVVNRGSSEGRARSFTVAGSAYLSAILHPPLKPQDRSRFVMMTLRKLETGKGAAGRAEKAFAAIKKAADLAPGIKARAFQNWHRFLDTVEMYRKAMVEDDVEPRGADTYAAILGGRDMLVRDDLPGQSEIDGDIARIGHLLIRASDRDGDNDGDQCLAHLYSSQVESWSAGERQTVGELLMEFQVPNALRNDINRKLGRAGLRVRYDRKTNAVITLLVAHRHVGLDRIFANTRWSGGVWTQALGDLQGSGSGAPTHFAGSESVRPTTLPPNYLPPPDGDERGDSGDAAGALGAP